MSHEPIEPKGFLYGATVVDIGDMRVSRGITRRPVSKCAHVNLVYDSTERRIWCSDCERDMDPFDAFESLVSRWNEALVGLKSRAAEVADAERRSLRRRAAKVMDEAWSSRSMAPTCPHCDKAILPEDVVRGVGMVNVEMELRRRKK